MNVLIIINETDEGKRKDFLDQIVRAAVTTVHVNKLNCGFDVESKSLIESVREGSVFDLIIHHCGTMNSEYQGFISSYRVLKAERGWVDPAIILFSGAPDSVDEAVRAYSTDVMVCAVSQDDLGTNLRPFLEAGLRRLPHDPPWDILMGYPDLEIPLQILSALLPFGLLWEAKDKESLKGLADQQEGFGSRINLRLREHLTKNLTVWPPAGFEKLINVADKSLAKSVGEEDKLAAWRAANISAPPEKLDSALKLLTDCETFQEWNRRLTALRDTLLSN